MNSLKRICAAVFGFVSLGCASTVTFAQEGLGPLMPNEGGTVTTAWANAYGPDAESWIRFANVGSSSFDINYSSSRGTVAVRRILVSDRMAARSMILGYSAKMPLIIENTTTLGTSTAVLEELRTTGQATSNLIYTAELASMPGVFTLAEKGKMSLNIDGHIENVPVIHAIGSFQSGKQNAKGDFWFLDNRNNPMLLQYNIKFAGEKVPRSESYVRVDVGAAERGKLEQTLAARDAYVTHGIHFDFDKATIRNTSRGLLDEIAMAMNNNPLWTLQITGHTDSIGEASYNQKLSQQRANAINSALVKRGVAADRLTTAGAGASDPVASNKTLQGRAQNRRVVLRRTDR
jgi:outer membrane protein OmpA-like peptidoglycan-associated protein